MPTASTDAATAATALRPATRESAAAPVPIANPFATLPALAPALPEGGRRLVLPALAGSGDALALAQIALAASERHRTLAIVCSDALAATRLAEEIAWFAPALSVSVFPDWETLPY